MCVCVSCIQLERESALSPSFKEKVNNPHTVAGDFEEVGGQGHTPSCDLGELVVPASALELPASEVRLHVISGCLGLV